MVVSINLSIMQFIITFCSNNSWSARESSDVRLKTYKTRSSCVQRNIKHCTLRRASFKEDCRKVEKVRIFREI